MHNQAFLMINYTPWGKKDKNKKKIPNSLVHIEGGKSNLTNTKLQNCAFFRGSLFSHLPIFSDGNNKNEIATLNSLIFK